MPGLGYYGAAPPQVIYDGLGNPLGLPFLAALAMLSSLLPSLASGAAKILPGLSQAHRAACARQSAPHGAFDAAAATRSRASNAPPPPASASDTVPDAKPTAR